MWVGCHYVRAFHKSGVGWGISARAHVHPHLRISGSEWPIVLNLMCGWRPNSYEIYRSLRWGDCTFARATPVSLSWKPLSPDIEATPKTNLPISFALARSSPNMASYWYLQMSVTLSMPIHWLCLRLTSKFYSPMSPSPKSRKF